jgi:hypothetical protein
MDDVMKRLSGAAVATAGLWSAGSGDAGTSRRMRNLRFEI